MNKRFYKYLAEHKKNVIFVCVSVIILYIIIPYIMAPRPVINNINPDVIMTGTKFNNKNSIVLEGENLSSINGLYINGVWVDNYAVILQNDKKLEIVLPAEYYKNIGKNTLKVERRLNSDYSSVSNEVVYTVLSDDVVSKPYISTVFPEKLVYDGRNKQKITVSGSGINKNSLIEIDGVIYNTFYSENNYVYTYINYEYWCDKKNINVKIVQEYDGLVTQITSTAKLVSTEYFEGAESVKPEIWSQLPTHILSSKSLFDSKNVKNRMEEAYKSGQRMYELDFYCAEDGKFYLVDSVENYYNEMPMNLDEIQSQLGSDTIDLEQLCEMMDIYSDMYVLVDVSNAQNIDILYKYYDLFINNINNYNSAVGKRFVYKAGSIQEYCIINAKYMLPMILDCRGLEAEEIEKAAEMYLNGTLLSKDDLTNDLLEKFKKRQCRLFLADNGQENLEYYAEMGVYGWLMDEEVSASQYYNELKGIWELQIIQEHLQEMSDANSYLKHLSQMSDLNIICVIAVKDDATALVQEDTYIYMQNLGIDLLELEDLRASYLLIKDNCLKIEEKKSIDANVSADYEKDNFLIIVSSGGLNADNEAHIYINDVDYSLNNRGMNIVLYHKTTGEVIESSNIDFYGGSILTKKSFLQEINEQSYLDIDKIHRDEMLKRFQGERYLMLITIAENYGIQITDSINDMFVLLNCSEISESKEKIKMYAAVIDGGNVLKEQSDDEEVAFFSKVNGIPYQVKCNKEEKSIWVNNVAIECEGDVSIIVIDKIDGTVIKKLFYKMDK